MSRAHNSFDIMTELHARMPRISPRWLWAWRIVYMIRAAWRHVRVSQPLTWMLGPQYKRSRDMIEIDITYHCNLHCLNCNRSVTQARDARHMPLDMVCRFVDDSIRRGKVWRRIRVLGGEPTLHPEFPAIIEELRRYKVTFPNCIVEVATNGHGRHVNAKIAQLPDDVMVDNSSKESRYQPHFGPFNLAPVDDWRHRFSNYSNACAIARDCGMGLTPMGYYPCAVAGGIDRILEEDVGRQSLPDDDDDLLDAAQRLCAFCGRFRDGHFVPRVLRPALREERISKSWQTLYAEWHARRMQDQTSNGTVRSQVDPRVQLEHRIHDPAQTA